MFAVKVFKIYLKVFKNHRTNFQPDILPFTPHVYELLLRLKFHSGTDNTLVKEYIHFYSFVLTSCNYSN